MRFRYTFLIAAMIAGLADSSPNLAFGQTRLGLHVTQEELTIWKQRANSGPYKSAGDVSTNSPGDWSRINNNANAFRSGSATAETWAGQTDNSCWSPSSSPAKPGRTRGEKIRDTAFRFLVLGNTADRDHVLTGLLNQASQAGTNFSDSTRWNINTGCATGDGHSWEITAWLRKLLYAYDYIRNSISSTDRARLDTWFNNAASFWETNIHATISKRFPNRLSDDYTTLSSGATSCVSPRVTHFGGFTKCSFHEGWSNRSASHVLFFGASGLLTGNKTLQDRAKRWYREWLRFHVFADNTDAEFHRWTSSQPTLGWGYAGTLIADMATLADLFARAGDTSLIEYETSSGHSTANLTPPGGPKSLFGVITHYMRHVDGSLVRYGTDQAGYNGNSNYKIDTIDNISGHQRNNDTYLAQINVFFKDAYIRSVYLRQSSGAPAYPSSPASGGYCVWCGEWGTLPGVLFMFGQMEGKVSPYPGSSPLTSTEPSTEPSTNPIGHWKFDEGTGTVAKDSSGKGNDATLVNGAAWTSGKSGTAVSFDGLDDFIKIATTNFATTQGTFSAWVKAAGFKSVPQYIFGHTTTPIYGSRIQLYTSYGNGNLDLGLGASHTTAINTHQLQANIWYHITLTWNSGTYAVYINGLQKSMGTYSGLSSLNSYAHIGGVGYDSDAQSWTGAIDEVKVWNRALSATEAQSEFNSYQASPPAAPSTVVAQPLAQ